MFDFEPEPLQTPNRIRLSEVTPYNPVSLFRYLQTVGIPDRLVLPWTFSGFLRTSVF